MTWVEYAKTIQRLENKYLPKTKKAIKDYKNSFTILIQRVGLSTAVSKLHTVVMSEDIVKVLEGIYKDGGVLGAKTTNRELKSGLKAFPGLGQAAQWVLEVTTYLKKNILKLAANITETMRGDVLRAVTKGVEQGWSVDMIVKEINNPDLTDARARVITRTESVRAFNTGNTIGAKAFPFEVNKTWVSARDHRVRHSHVKANGQTVGEHDSFIVDIYRGDKKIGTEPMLFPGDPKAHPSNTVNCRCRVTYSSVKDGEGRPVPRASRHPVMIG